MSKGRPKGSGIGVSKSLSISITPAQREFLSRVLAGTGATVAGYIRVLIEKDMAKEQEAGTEGEKK
jgi:hypothetical protein